MARKYDTISALAERTAKEVVKNEENWKTYLNTAARIYKYTFQEPSSMASVTVLSSYALSVPVNSFCLSMAL